MMNIRKWIYTLVDDDYADSIYSIIYNIVMVLAIFISMIPLAFKETSDIFILIDKITVSLFIIDYFFRILTADFYLNKGTKSFIIYPFTFFALIDLVSILPSIILIPAGYRLFKLFRLFRTFKTLRIIRYSKNIQIILNVIKKQKRALLAVGSLAVWYVLISALIVFNVEPDTFDNFFEAIYWACVSLTTMGYGDIYPITTTGRIITIISAFIGIAIIALPSGIITAGYMEELKNSK